MDPLSRLRELQRIEDELAQLVDGVLRRMSDSQAQLGDVQWTAEATSRLAARLEEIHASGEGLLRYWPEGLSARTGDLEAGPDVLVRLNAATGAVRRQLAEELSVTRTTPATTPRPRPTGAGGTGAAPVVIQCAITGSTPPDPEGAPNLPITTDAIVAEALAAWRAGASVIHLHGREADGTPTNAAGALRPVVDALRGAGCDAILNLSCGTAGGRLVRDERLAPLELAPEMASLDCGSINFGDRIFEGDVPFLRRMARAMLDRGVRPELECFDTGHVGLALQLREEGLLEDPMVFQFVVGVPGTGVPATVEQIEHLRRLVPADAPWSVCAVGRAQLALNTYCIIAGGNVRTGLEDNLFYARGDRATNARLVERVVRLAAELQRPVATPAQARELLAVP